MIYLFRLVKGGYGSLAEVKELSAREVLQALQYDEFLANYEVAYMEMNKQ